MPRLLHFELRIDDPMDVIGDEQWTRWSRHSNADIEDANDIISGHQWKYLVPHLQTFDFRFCLLNRSDEKILDSFRSTFWLEQKQWFVAYDDYQSPPCLFTVPRFAPKNIIYSSDYNTPWCTSSNLGLDQFVDVLTLPKFRPVTHDFINMTSLILKTDNNLTLDTILPFMKLPHLQSLAVSSMALVTQLSTETMFESIRSLTIDTIVVKSHAEQICIVFPRLERLQIGINDQDTMLLLIDGLKHLSIVMFLCCQSLRIKPLTYEWFIQNSSRLMGNNNFTCHINDNKIHLWMSIE
ncbi:unnamed protein product [Rotaria sp. Silwood1]|nr:unnamed protein product [Rotaria sp. Silwood1]